MSAWDALEAKHRRVVIVPVQVSDPATVVQEMQTVAAAIGMARENGDMDTVASLNVQLTELQTAYQGHFWKVRIQSLPAPDWEAATALHEDENGRFNWAMALPELLAASCVDPDLRDAGRWKNVLSSPAWSDGDVKALQAAVLHLNTSAMDALIPKD